MSSSKKNSPIYKLLVIAVMCIPLIACGLPESEVAYSDPPEAIPTQVPDINLPTLDKIWMELEKMNNDIKNATTDLEQLRSDVETNLFDTAQYIESIQSSSVETDENLIMTLQSEIQDVRSSIDTFTSVGYVDEIRWNDDLEQLRLDMGTMSGVIESLGYDSQLQLTDKVSELNAQLEEIWRSIETINFEIESDSQSSYIDIRIDEVNNSIGDVSYNIDNTSYLLDQLSYQFEILQSEVSESNNNDSTDRLQQELNDFRNSIPYDLQNNMDNLSTQVQELTANLDNNKYLNDLDIQSLESEIIYLKERINELSSP